ncbi:hypothetical protein MKY96_05245 [Paenibacillus sp. FSL R7-0302]|uniref:hypothetical protein n=1 Tax=Paenibacillus sp. FSL R7-0302 TaxID=2921681 RepID=UPI0030F66799
MEKKEKERVLRFTFCAKVNKCTKKVDGVHSPRYGFFGIENYYFVVLSREINEFYVIKMKECFLSVHMFTFVVVKSLDEVIVML